MKKNTEKIVLLAQEKVEIKRMAVVEAIDKLKSDNKDITFSTVSKEAGVSRNYLYKSDEFRLIIESLRKTSIKKVQSKDAKDLIIETQKRKIDELNKQLKKYSSYDELEKKYNDALSEIEELKKQLKKAYKY